MLKHLVPGVRLDKPGPQEVPAWFIGDAGTFHEPGDLGAFWPQEWRTVVEWSRAVRVAPPKFGGLYRIEATSGAWAAEILPPKNTDGTSKDQG